MVNIMHLGAGDNGSYDEKLLSLFSGGLVVCLYEARFGSEQSSMRSGMIDVAQHHRVALLSTAKWAAFALGLSVGKEICFQVGHDQRMGESCSIKFMTAGSDN
ncbi:RNA helicase family protein [Actinidia rufa]|uniref:RNA helicase family protein n=1 Tax=Actinidia rufa TaxID=165716 RepID=A0A7J0DHX0_9ERIC|nr:RNA helicase family protein [Actinidia rufa]